MNDPGPAWLQVVTPWSPAPAHLPANRWEDFLTADPATHTTGLNLLPLPAPSLDLSRV